ncbi:MAG: hypothetical protein C0594_15740 [Marinilabiliales bacterium]|nr:MAG: hypothetical protein C0594_15740 [Marinilabiliales bacterium]
MGDYETALKYYKKYKAIEDSIFSENKHKTVAELEIRFETQKKQQELELLQQTNRNQELEIRKNHYLVIGLIVVLLSIIIISLLILRQNKMKDAQKNLMLEQKLLRLQMNPHFIFNTLTAIQNFIYKSQQKEAANFLSRFAKLVRLILENSREEYISLEKELTTLEYYLQLQELRFKGKTSYDLYVDDKLEVDFLAIPPMLAQPFIENAIEHGILPKKDKGHISVRFLKKEEFILFEVEDNGIGRVESAKIKKEESHKSLATALTNERLVILNKRLRNKIMLNIEDLYEGSEASGTKVSFSIPYRTPDN